MFDQTKKTRDLGRPILVAILLVLIIILAFYRLGNGEIQSWDEAMYLIRANACTQWQAWFDQTPYSPGGLYSSTHPPLGIWFFAFSRTLFGVSSFASRLPSALGYLLAIVSFFVLIRRHSSVSSALLAAASLASAQLYVWYAHHAQLDSLLMGWTLASIALFSAGRDNKKISPAIFGGIAFGCALLTKFAFGLTVLPFFAMYVFADKSLWKRVVLFTCIGIAIALPWYLWMQSQYPAFGFHAMQLASNGSYEMPGHYHWWYYLNQCIVSLPLLVPALMAIAFSIWENRNKITSQLILLVPALVWFLTTFILLQVVETKMPHFALLLFPAAAILIACGYEVTVSQRSSQTVIAISGILSVAWSLSEQLRLWVTARLSPSDIIIPKPNLLVLLAFFAALLAAFYWLHGPSKAKLAIALGLFLVGSQIFRWTSYSGSFADDGAAQIVEKASSAGIQNITVLSKQAPHVSLIPQLTYYSQAMLSDRDSQQRWRSIDWNTGLTFGRDSLIIPYSAMIIDRKKDRLAERSSEDSSRLSQLQILLSQSYSHILHTRSYDIYY